MKLYRPNVMNVIMLVPLAMAMSDNGGCSSTPEPGPITTEQIQQQFVGNTLQIAGREIFAFDENGTWRGQNLPNGAKSGTWRLSDNGVLCSKPDVANSQENCDIVRYVGEADFKWAGGDLKVFEGNPKEL
jgi:hypothetical protein